MKRERIQSPTRVFIYSYIGTYDKQQHAPKMKKINTMKQICETYMNLKPCKGNRIVSMNTVDFYDALRQLFSDKKNLKIISKRFNFIQSNLCKQNEFTKAQKSR